MKARNKDNDGPTVIKEYLSRDFDKDIELIHYEYSKNIMRHLESMDHLITLEQRAFRDAAPNGADPHLPDFKKEMTKIFDDFEKDLEIFSKILGSLLEKKKKRSIACGLLIYGRET